jgi:hypothetical protein
MVRTWIENSGLSHRAAVAALAEGGRMEEAARAIRKGRELVPRLSLAIYRRPRVEGTLWQKFIDGLRKAGLPEE